MIVLGKSDLDRHTEPHRVRALFSRCPTKLPRATTRREIDAKNLEGKIAVITGRGTAVDITAEMLAQPGLCLRRLM